MRQKTGRRLLSLPLTLAVAVGLGPATSVTAYAQAYAADGSIDLGSLPTGNFSVTLTPGSNMTKTTDSGAASQTGLSGEMTDVVFTANDGFYFPEDYKVESTNGISVNRDSFTQITVSGSPSAVTEITLPAPTEKATTDAPTTVQAFDCASVGDNDGKLTGLTSDMEFKKSDGTNWTDVIGTDITDLAPGTYDVRVKETDTTKASNTLTFNVADYLTGTKNTAKLDLDSLLPLKTQSDYETEDWTKLTQAIADGKASIDAATTVDGVKAAKDAAVSAFKALSEKMFEGAKKSATIAVNAVDAQDYVAADRKTVEDAKSAALAAIDAATTPEQVKVALAGFNKAIEGCESQIPGLAPVKANARAAVNVVSSNTYIPADRKAVEDAKNTAIAAIDAATKPEQVKAALDDFNNAIAKATPTSTPTPTPGTTPTPTPTPGPSPVPTPVPTPDPAPYPDFMRSRYSESSSSSDSSEPAEEKVGMYRMFEPATGEHFYTASDAERDELVEKGWTYEGIAFYAPKKSNTPVWRLFNPETGEHLYTTDAAEKRDLLADGWNGEGVAWYSDDAQGKAMYRLLDPSAAPVASHHFTSSEAERSELLAAGWTDQGVGFYACR